MDPKYILTIWLVRAMLSWLPPQAGYNEFEKTQIAMRYEGIAADVQGVAYAYNEDPFLPNPNPRAREALLALAIASFESGFDENIEHGGCRHRDNCDSGRSVGLMQLQPSIGLLMKPDGTFAYDKSGWNKKDLTEDRTKHFTAGMHIMRVSFKDCKSLAEFASGHCDAGLGAARNRQRRADRWYSDNPPPVTDADVIRGVIALPE